MADALFEQPRLVELYDLLEAERADLDVYVALAGELGARRILDIGCGTGTLACLLAHRGYEVTGVDPARASLAVARAKVGAERVKWVEGDATTLPPRQVDVATMTGNVAQVFVTDEEWVAVLRAVRAVLAPGGYLVFETRDPDNRAWTSWHRAASYRQTVLPDVGGIETWVDVTEVQGLCVSFRSTFVFDRDGAVMTSDSTLRFRTRDEVVESLRMAGLRVREERDAPDRPGCEMVFLATPATWSP